MPLTPSRPSASSGLGGAAPARAEVGLEPLDHPLLVRAEPDRVGAEPDLVPLALDDPLRLQRGQELGEDPLLGVAGPAAQLLPRDPAAQGVLGVEGLEEAQRLGAQAIARVAVQVPLAVHREHAAGVLEPLEQLRGAGRARRASGRGDRRPARPPTPACFRCSSSTAEGSPVASSARWAASAGPLRLKRGGAMSSTVPPPIVTMGE